jgi:hypothetical protein
MRSTEAATVVPGATFSEPPGVSQLRCESCRLIYSLAAIAREPTLTSGVSCRRCGGTLELDEAPGRRFQRRTVVAVRSAVTGQARLPFG